MGAKKDLTRSLHNFATWAFGPHGISSLRMIAFGDFSDMEKFDEGNVILYPADQFSMLSERNYLQVDLSDKSRREVFKRYSHLVEACSTKSLTAT